MNDAQTELQYGCYNKPRPTRATTYPGQEGWYSASVPGTSKATRLPRIVQIPVRMSLECMYDKQHSDPRCAGCVNVPVDAEFNPAAAEGTTGEAVTIPLTA
jgi:hypothetical protein